MTTLMKGDKHSAVGKLQDALNRLGATPRLAVDNDYGNFTKIAVRRFQESQEKLTCTYGGIAGPETLERLGIRLAVDKLVLKTPLAHNPSENWAAPLGVKRVTYSTMGIRNSDPGQVIELITYIGTGFVLSGYDTLVGGRIAPSHGVYVYHGPKDPDRVEVDNNECAARPSVWTAANAILAARPRVLDAAGLLPGTVVATMRDNQYYSDYSGQSHVAIFLSKDKHGIQTLDQWNGSDIHQEYRRFRPEDLGEPTKPLPRNYKERAYNWISDGDEYYVVYSEEKCVRRDYS